MKLNNDGGAYPARSAYLNIMVQRYRMKEIHDIETSVLDRDGSCRDLNFERPTWDGVFSMIGTIPTAFSNCEATDDDGRTVRNPSKEDIQAMISNGGYAQIVLNEGTELFKHLQVFISEEGDGSPFIELTFFPQDIKKTGDLRNEFLAWVNGVCEQLQACRFYARYENASWEFGDTSNTSGVFIVSDLYEENA